MSDWITELTMDVFTEDFFPTIVGKRIRQGGKEFVVGSLGSKVGRGLRVPVLVEKGDDGGGKATIVRHGGRGVVIIGIEEVGSTSERLPSLQDLLNSFPVWREERLG